MRRCGDDAAGRRAALGRRRLTATLGPTTAADWDGITAATTTATRRGWAPRPNVTPKPRYPKCYPTRRQRCGDDTVRRRRRRVDAAARQRGRFIGKFISQGSNLILIAWYLGLENWADDDVENLVKRVALSPSLGASPGALSAAYRQARWGLFLASETTYDDLATTRRRRPGDETRPRRRPGDDLATTRRRRGDDDAAATTQRRGGDDSATTTRRRRRDDAARTTAQRRGAPTRGT
eukprot:s201_g15.t1